MDANEEDQNRPAKGVAMDRAEAKTSSRWLPTDAFPRTRPFLHWSQSRLAVNSPRPKWANFPSAKGVRTGLSNSRRNP